MSVGNSGTELDHELLIRRARHWLQNTAGAKVVLTEFPGGAVGGSRRSRREIPDAIGWLRSGVSLVVECKVSRADFLADSAKSSREAGRTGPPATEERSRPTARSPRKTAGLGAYRFYLAPSGLLFPEELPEGWGLLELRASAGKDPGAGTRYTVRRAHDPKAVFDPRTGSPRRGLPDTRTRGTLQRENALALSALRLVQLRDLHGQRLSPSRSVYRNLGHPGEL